MNDMRFDLNTLPDPLPPSTLARTVMARVSCIEERQPARAIQPAREARRWVPALTGVVVVVVAWMAGQLAPRSLFELVRSQLREPNLATALPLLLALIALATGLFVYVAGLFAPVRDRR